MGTYFLKGFCCTNVRKTLCDDKTAAVMEGWEALINNLPGLSIYCVGSCPRQVISSWECTACRHYIILNNSPLHGSKLILSRFRPKLCHLLASPYEHPFHYLEIWKLKCPSLTVVFRVCEDNPCNFLQCQMHGQKTTHVCYLWLLSKEELTDTLWPGKWGASPTDAISFEGAFLAHNHCPFPDNYVLTRSGEHTAVTSVPLRPLLIEHGDRNGTKVGQSIPVWGFGNKVKRQMAQAIQAVCSKYYGTWLRDAASGF